MKPSNFILSSDYASVGNDGYGTLEVTIPANTVVTAAALNYSVSAVANIGTKSGGNFRCLGSSSKGSGYYYGTAFWTIGKGTAGAPISGAVPYPTRVNIYRTSPTEIKLTATVINNLNPASTLTTGDAETITVKIRTMVVK